MRQVEGVGCEGLAAARKKLKQLQRRVRKETQGGRSDVQAECKELGATVLAPAPSFWGAFVTLFASIDQFCHVVCFN